ncbi:hypothetical protein PR048_023768 [Dryococelus australis]|uniref:J domain-containing protein n=1 Tax=Dryococelus australis TaxID=614101 RepID=A0ABQ9GV07_9NEOP|nr:hypothetical protein PR048_023768 [Dryococelus australis]
MSGVDSILNYTRSEDENYYAILGCDESATEEQINAEYKAKALQLHPDKNEGDKQAEIKFQLLKEAKEILCDPEKRSNYDKWRNSGIAISYKQWVGMKEHVHSSMHWSTLKTKDRMLPETAEGGANIHWGARRDVKWDSDASSEVVSKFRNYEI